MLELDGTRYPAKSLSCFFEVYVDELSSPLPKGECPLLFPPAQAILSVLVFMMDKGKRQIFSLFFFFSSLLLVFYNLLKIGPAQLPAEQNIVTSL